MAEPSVVAEPLPSNYYPDADADADADPLPIPPLDPAIFSDTYMSNLGDSFADDLGDLDFTFDDNCLFPDAVDFTTFLDPETFDADPAAFVTGTPNWDISDHNSTGPEVVSYPSSVSCPNSGDPGSDVAKFLNVSSPESSVNSGIKGSELDRRVSSNPLSEVPNGEDFGPASSQGSGNSGSAVLGTPSMDMDDSARSAASPNSSNNSAIGFVGEQIKLEEEGANNSLMKRKKQSEDVNSELVRTSKYRRSNPSENASQPSAMNDDDDKKKARLMRNRESAQLSRQRKKHYVEELEDKVRALHSTIQDLNTRMSYVMAENASLRQQLSGGAMCPPPMPPQAGMYPNSHMAPMGYPWMPCPPYVVKSQGSQVPLVPIPRLKPKQSTAAPKSKKVESKTKKVASVSFLGLLFFIALFGVLSPMINSKFESDHLNSMAYKNHHATVLNVNGSVRHEGLGSPNGKYGNRIHCGRGASDCEHRGRSNPFPRSEEFVRGDNSTESLVASLYVPRNDKLVKIDGNLIIHSVLASEKAMASQQDRGMKSSSKQTSLAVAIPGVGRSGRHPHLFRSPAGRQRALGSGSTNKDNLKSTKADGKLQQWFQEGLAGPLLSSGMCTEVFQFDVSSAPGAIVPATSIKKVSTEQRQNATRIAKGVLNRRILPGAAILPLSGSQNNITRKQVGTANPKEDNFGKNSSLSSSMVVSVLFDPREAGVDGEADGVMGPKSLSRIFVVVLIDSIKYVTYSCMLPLKGSAAAASTAAHLVTA